MHARPGAFRRRSGFGIGAAAALLVLGAPPRAEAQTGVELGLGVARNGDPAAALSDDGCAADESWAPEVRAGLRLSRAVRLEGVLAYHFEADVSCAIGKPPIPPQDGEIRSVSSPEAGYPYATSDLRLAVEPARPAGAAWLRAFGGYGRMWGKGTGYWLAGGGLVFGGRVATLLELEWNWFELPADELIVTFAGGEPVSERMERRATSHADFKLRFGFRWPL